MSNDLITKTKKSKAAAEGSHEWLNERVSALFSIPLLAWVVFSLVSFNSCGCFDDIKDFISNPINSIVLIILFGSVFNYCYLALKVVYEDYVSCNCAKWTLILGTKFICIFAFVAAVLAIVKIYAAPAINVIT